MISERHTTQQSNGFVWQERTAGSEYAERVGDEVTPLAVEHGYSDRYHDYTYGLSKADKRPIVEDENYDLLDTESKPKPKPRKRKVRKDQGRPRTRLERAQRAEPRHVYPTYPVSQPVVEAPVKAAPRYTVVQPVVQMPKPPWWHDRGRNKSVIDDLESLLEDMM